MPKLSTYSSTSRSAGPGGGRAARAADFGGGGQGMIQASKDVAAFANTQAASIDAQAAAAGRVAKRKDILAKAGGVSSRNSWELEKSPAYINSDLTKPQSMQEATQASLDYNANLLSNFEGTTEGSVKFSEALTQRHDSFVSTLSKQANSQSITQLDQVIGGDTNAFAAKAAENPLAWRDHLADGAEDLSSYQGSTPNTNIEAQKVTRSQAIMGASLDSFIKAENYTAAHDLVSSEPYRTMMTPKLQRSARVALNASRAEKTKSMTSGETLIYDYGVINGRDVPSELKAAWRKKHGLPTGGSVNTQMLALDTAFPRMPLKDRTMIYVALLTEGKIKDFGKTETGGVQDGYETFLKVNSLSKTSENRKIFDSLPLVTKMALAQSKPSDANKIKPPTLMDNANGRTAAFIGVSALTPEQAKNAKELGTDVKYAGQTYQEAVRSYRIIMGGEPPEKWLAAAQAKYPLAENVAFEGKSPGAVANNILLITMDSYRGNAGPLLPKDVEAFTLALGTISTNSVNPDTGVVIEAVGPTTAMLDFAELHNIPIPASAQAQAGSPSNDEVLDQKSRYTVRGQNRGIYGNVADYKGVGQALKNLAANLPFTGEPSAAERRVLNTHVKVKNLRINLINSMRPAGAGKMLREARKDIVDSLDGILLPETWANTDAARAKLEALSDNLTVQWLAAVKNAANVKGSSMKERRQEMAVANDIDDVLDALGVAPLIEDKEAKSELEKGAMYRVADPENPGDFLHFRKE